MNYLKGCLLFFSIFSIFFFPTLLYAQSSTPWSFYNNTSQSNAMDIFYNGVGSPNPAVRISTAGFLTARGLQVNQTGFSFSHGLQTFKPGSPTVYTSVYTGSSDDSYFQNNSGAFFRLDTTGSYLNSANLRTAGKVGIQTANTPPSDLYIKQSSNSQTTGGITIERAGDGNRSYIMMGGDGTDAYGGTGGRLYFFVASTSQYVTINSQGRVTSTGGYSPESSRSIKENLTPIDNHEILRKIDNLPVMQWNYKKQPSSLKHIGPFAEDFYAAFGLDSSDKTINVIDEAGVALAGIKALSEKSNKQQVEIELLKKEIALLKEQIANLKK